MKRFNASKWITKNKYGKPLQEQGLNRMDRDMTPEEEKLKTGGSPGTSTPIDPVGASGNIKKVVNLKMDSEVGEPVTVESNLK